MLAIAIVALSVWILRQDRDGSAAAGGEDLGPRGSVTELVAGDPPASGCVQPTPISVAANDLAFEGTVSAIEPDGVTLTAEHFYRGVPSREVTVRPGRGGDLADLLARLGFEEGDRYLVAAHEGAVAMCGVTSPWTTEGQALYVNAFGSRS